MQGGSSDECVVADSFFFFNGVSVSFLKEKDVNPSLISGKPLKL